jgi:hypothetical protein
MTGAHSRSSRWDPVKNACRPLSVSSAVSVGRRPACITAGSRVATQWPDFNLGGTQGTASSHRFFISSGPQARRKEARTLS